MYESFNEKGLTEELLRCLMQKVVVRADGGVEIQWNFMDEVSVQAYSGFQDASINSSIETRK